MKYSSPVLSIDDQIKYLVSKGLIISDQPKVKEVFSIIGFFKLRSYFGNFIEITGSNYTFNKGVDFYDILDVYEYDNFLRITLFEAISNIEVAIKSIMNNVMCASYGTHWYLNQSIFKQQFISIRVPHKCSQYDDLVASIRKECEEHKVGGEDSAIKNYCNYYTDPDLPPSWMALDILSFGKISIIYQNLLPTIVRNKIAEPFGIHDVILQSWLRSISYVRNLCAHHSRITYRAILKPPVIIKGRKNIFLKENDIVDPSSIYYVLCCTQYLLIKIKCDHFLRRLIFQSFSDFGSVNPQMMGFTPNWKDEKIWEESK